MELTSLAMIVAVAAAVLVLASMVALVRDAARESASATPARTRPVAHRPLRA